MKDVIERAIENKSEEKVAFFLVKQKQNYTFKRAYAEIRAYEFCRGVKHGL